MVLIERLEPVLQEVTTYLIICMLALQSTVRPASSRNMGPDFSDNTGA